MRPAPKTWNAVLFCLLLLALIVAGCVSKNQPRVAVVVDGKLSAPVVTAVDDALAADYSLLSKREYRQAAADLKAKSMSPAHVRQVAQELGLSSVVYATVRGKKIQLQLRDGGTGRPVWRFSARLEKGKLRAKDRRRLENGLPSHANAVEAKNAKRRERIAEKEQREQAKREKEEEKLRAAQEKKEQREQAKREKEEEKLRAAQEREKAERELEEMRIKVDDSGQAIDDEDPTLR